MDNMKLIEAKTVGAGGIASVTFSSIPQTYTDLYILVSARTTRAAYLDDLTIRFNGSTSNYTGRILYTDSGTSVGTFSYALPGFIQGNNSTTDTFGSMSIYITNYSTSNFKAISADGVSENNATEVGMSLVSNLWSDTTAVTSFDLLSTSAPFMQHTTFYLYGISNTTAGTGGAKATGGYVSEDTNYFYHTFLSSGVFTPTTNLTCEYVTIAGGGGGAATGSAGVAGGGGGGAGGFRTTSRSFTSGTGYVITVGAGGAGRTTSSAGAGNNGSNSQISGSGFATWTSTGGGGGGLEGVAGGVGESGGSAGGNGRSATTPTGNAGGYSPPEGTNGGAENGGAVGGGGGGATSAGGTLTGSLPNRVGGAGGSGSNALATWATATLTGVQGYYAGGGGGGAYIATWPAIDTEKGGPGGLGGGGDGGGLSYNPKPGNNAIANTGSGGGGGNGGSATFQSNAGNGGSGLIILRYAK